MPIITKIQRHAPDQVAIRIGALEISYGRFLADVGAAAAFFATKGITERSKVGVRAGSLPTGHSYANWVAHLALIRLGASHVSTVEPASVSAALQSGMIDTMIASRGTLDEVPPTLKQVEFDCDPTRPLAAAPATPSRESNARRLNLTSGTTGKPKFLAWDAAMIQQRIDQVGEGLALGPGTILYPLLHIRTTAGFRYPMAVWQAGGCVLLPEDQDPDARDRAALGPSTLIAASPVQLAERVRMFPDPWEGRDGRTIIVLGGRLPSAVRDAALANACASLLISYGATETGSVALGDSALIDRHGGAVGHLRSGVTVEILDAAQKPVAPGEPGLIRIKADLMCDGYEGVQHSGPGPFADGYFYPGDIGRLFEDGLLAIEGRINDTFNVGGWKVNAVDLEAKLAFLPGVDDLCACVMPLAEGDLLTIAVVCREKVDLTEVARRIQVKLPKGRTFHLVRIKAIPRNAMGKIPRAMIANKLTALYGASRKNIANA
jgi:acyl-CoA synthetase (AMP-forming)/AMP-acid ligase II